ncbi:MAG TPA: A24 family peptidase C-terminal domain-containing protein [Candidatus Thermoplasmatota archaeon]|nr:A24 family peptidase C-terminal domain-containing protein [Candidatus Thermoplasmatota archaeon]
MLPFLDVLRLFLGASVLAFASYTDWKWRRAPNVLWLLLSAAGVAFLAAEAFADAAPWSAKWPYLLPLSVVALLLSERTWSDVASVLAGVGGSALAVAAGLRAPELVAAAWPSLAVATLLAFGIYGMWYAGLIAGGADAKALLACCVLLPFPLALADGLPLLAAPVPGAFSVLGNSLVLFLVIPLGFLVWNAAHGDLRFPHLVLGVKRRAADVRRGHQWPMEVVDESGARRTKLFASRMTDEEVEATFERVQALGDERVWVSPKIPFMIPMLAGFLAAFFVGDLLMALLSRVVAP